MWGRGREERLRDSIRALWIPVVRVSVARSTEVFLFNPSACSCAADMSGFSDTWVTTPDTPATDLRWALSSGSCGG